MSRRLLQRQTSVEQSQSNTTELDNRPIHELWLRSDNKKKTSETTKIQQNDLPVVFQSLVPSYSTAITRSPANNASTSTNTTASTSAIHSYADLLSLSPNMSSPGSMRTTDDDIDNTLLNQLQVRRARPEHSPSDLSPNFSPSFSPRFVPQSRPRTLLAYLQNFGQNNNTQQQNINGTQGDPHRTAVSFLSRVFGSNPPTPPQTQFGSNNTENTTTDEAVSTSNELTQYQSQNTNNLNNFPSGSLIVRTVQSGPNGSMIVNMRVLSLEDMASQQDLGGLDAGNSELFGSLMNLLAGLQGVNMFTFSDMSGFISGERGLDRRTIQNLPAVTYGEEAFKNVDSESKKCTICLEHFEEGNEVKYLWCLHRFHTNCVDQWLHKHSNCPVCKKDYSECEDYSE